MAQAASLDAQQKRLDAQQERFEAANCAMCGGASTKPAYHFEFDGETSDVVRCDGCGLAFSSPRPKPSALGAFYGAGYYSFGPPKLPDATQPLSAKERLRRAILVRHLGYPASLGGDHPVPELATAALARFMAIPQFKEGGTLLDVGCGSGERMAEYASFGWQVTGLEFSEDAAKAGRSVGLDIRTGDIIDSGLEPESFDCITFYHSLEHVYDPAATLIAAHRLLKPGGELLVAVPNFGSSERRIFGKNWGWLQMPTHLYHFDKSTLSRFVADAGFTDISVRHSFHGYSVDGAIFGALRKPAELMLKLYALPAAMIGDGKALTLSAHKKSDI